MHAVSSKLALLAMMCDFAGDFLTCGVVHFNLWLPLFYRKILSSHLTKWRISGITIPAQVTFCLCFRLISKQNKSVQTCFSIFFSLKK